MFVLLPLKRLNGLIQGSFSYGLIQGHHSCWPSLKDNSTVYNMEYKFRGKRIDNGEWAYGNLIEWQVGDKEIIVQTGSGRADKVSVVKESVGMWTGLKDKNGKEIYEGDILKSFSPSVPSYEVFYDRSSYRLRYKLKCGDWYDWGPLFRMEEIQWEGRLPICPDVIGNIYDNPELLNPPAESLATDTIHTDPNVKAEGQEQEAATESAAQDTAMEATQESAEEGTTEG